MRKFKLVLAAATASAGRLHRPWRRRRYRHLPAGSGQADQCRQRLGDGRFRRGRGTSSAASFSSTASAGSRTGPSTGRISTASPSSPALPSGEYLVRQRKSDERQVPKFRSDMTAPEIAAMLETAFRVRGGAIEFKTLSLQPRQFLGYPGFQFDFEHLDSDELWRKGRAVGAVDRRAPLPDPLRRHALALLRECAARLRGDGQQRAHPLLSAYADRRGRCRRWGRSRRRTSIGGRWRRCLLRRRRRLAGLRGSRLLRLRGFGWLLLHD